MKKTLSLRKYGEVILTEDFIPVPIKTLSVGEEAAIKFPLPKSLPTKITVLTEKDKETLKQMDPSYKPEVYLATKVVDTTSEVYRTYEEQITKFSPILDAVKYVNLNKEIEYDGVKQPFYKAIGITNPKDLFEVCEKFEELGLADNHVEKIILAAKALKGDSISERLYKLQNITGMDYITLMTALEEFIDKREVAREKALREIEKLTDEKLGAMLTEEIEEEADK